MNFDEYQELARRTQSKDLSGDDKLYHALFGLCSEVGEVHSVMQHLYQGQRYRPREKIAEEVGDLMWFVAELCDAISVTMDQVAESNINKLRRRYPEGFDTERSAHRHEIEKEGEINEKDT